jgi:uncharacterized protein YecT (DUF1311 family)
MVDEYKKADAELKSFLERVRDVVTEPDDKIKLDQAQEAWAKYRDLTCGVESRVYFDHGSGSSTEEATCLEAETRLQLKDLHKLYDWRIEWMLGQSAYK